MEAYMTYLTNFIVSYDDLELSLACGDCHTVIHSHISSEEPEIYLTTLMAEAAIHRRNDCVTD